MPSRWVRTSSCPVGSRAHPRAVRPLPSTERAARAARHRRNTAARIVLGRSRTRISRNAFREFSSGPAAPALRRAARCRATQEVPALEDQLRRQPRFGQKDGVMTQLLLRCVHIMSNDPRSTSLSGCLPEVRAFDTPRAARRPSASAPSARTGQTAYSSSSTSASSSSPPGTTAGISGPGSLSGPTVAMSRA
jgi:hypothetical protein